ncbi:phosphatidylinositol transfer protein csr1 [Coemansia sp. RSA 2049]|nr:phosphatidylinositol transfer protein csr1 [Coemansia sp. RSA 2049]KAJ2520994.1 phosphatidylinositol transfer protein csr1 [Coemansia sp. RSA 1939]KAJ2615082.1 phosphatidylinositol transfer protein csr1 [Coemansia sp. RSA 1804]KAJ2683890.1 phosphatidylinositol transfer protein csr1 [Coemansia sp. RSA 1285]
MAPQQTPAGEANGATPQLTLKEHYHQRVAHTSGRVGWLTAEQEAKLRELWALLLAEFGRNERLPVVYSLAQRAGGGDHEASDITALSFEPLETLGSEPRKRKEPQPQPRWPAAASRSKPATPVPESASPPAAARTATPDSAPAAAAAAEAESEAEPEEEEEEDEDSRRRLETVQAYATRTQPESDPIVPAEFVPLFGEAAGERSQRAAFWQAAAQTGDADSWVLRYLRARSWDVAAALAMIRRTLVWRTAQAIDEIAHYGEAQLHAHTMRAGLAYACTSDNLDNPVYVVRVRVNEARHRSVAAIKRFLCWQIETAQLLAAGRADGRVTILFDLAGFSRDNIDLALVRTLITLLTNYYPETLGILILHVNSWVFSALWALIAPFIDPAVKAKIVMAKSAAEIAPFIARDRLVAEVGGAKPFAYDYVLPTAEENRRMADAAARSAAEAAFVAAVAAYEAATRRWLDAADSGADAERIRARDALRSAAADLDPFVRARTLYHRLGFIRADRSVQF